MRPGLSEALDRFKRAIGKCRQFTGKAADGSKMSCKVTPLSFPKFGDDTFALRMSGTSEGITVNMDLVAVRDGGLLILVANSGLAHQTKTDTSVSSPTPRNRRTVTPR